MTWRHRLFNENKSILANSKQIQLNLIGLHKLGSLASGVQKHISVTVKMSMHTSVWFSKTWEANFRIIWMCDCWEAEIIKYFWHLNLCQLRLISTHCPIVAKQHRLLRGKLTFDHQKLIRGWSQDGTGRVEWLMGGGCYCLITLLSHCLRNRDRQPCWKQPWKLLVTFWFPCCRATLISWHYSLLSLVSAEASRKLAVNQRWGAEHENFILVIKALNHSPLPTWRTLRVVPLYTTHWGLMGTEQTGLVQFWTVTVTEGWSFSQNISTISFLPLILSYLC